MGIIPSGLHILFTLRILVFLHGFAGGRGCDETAKNGQSDDYRAGQMARILLAEDDESMRRFLAKALENAGHDVVPCGKGDEAHGCLKEDVFDILLTDIVMPEMDGIELARLAAELDPTLKIMFITGFAAVALNPEVATPREAKVLSKPFHLRDLVAEVDRLMAAA